MEKESKPTIYTLIYWLIEDEKIEPDQLFDFLELYWPTLVEKGPCCINALTGIYTI
jgi:hypothetical protein